MTNQDESLNNLQANDAKAAPSDGQSAVQTGHSKVSDAIANGGNDLLGEGSQLIDKMYSELGSIANGLTKTELGIGLGIGVAMLMGFGAIADSPKPAKTATTTSVAKHKDAVLPLETTSTIVARIKVKAKVTVPAPVVVETPVPTTAARATKPPTTLATTTIGDLTFQDGADVTVETKA